MSGIRDPRLIVAHADRVWLLDAFGRGLEPGESILQLTDTYRQSGRHTVQLPTDASAEVLLLEAPRVMPGGVTEILSYVKTRDRTIRETTFRDGTVEHQVDRVVRAYRSWELAMEFD